MNLFLNQLNQDDVLSKNPNNLMLGGRETVITDFYMEGWRRYTGLRLQMKDTI